MSRYLSSGTLGDQHYLVDLDDRRSVEILGDQHSLMALVAQRSVVMFGDQRFEPCLMTGRCGLVFFSLSILDFALA